jgi:hypothetical protein
MNKYLERESPHDQYISSVEWRFAKTMSKIPHWYTVSAWSTEDREKFMRLAEAIRVDGYDENFCGRTYRYLNIGDFKYWTMDPVVQETTLINRAKRV